VTVVDAPRLRRSWAEPAGLVAWFATVDHKRIGTRYMATALVFFFLGGLEAAALRAQLARPEERLLSPEAYDQLFSMHGLTMIFLFATPMLSGFGNYFVPLQIGARDMAFPKLNALGYWIFLGAGLFMYSGLVLGKAPNAGWFNYVPLSAEQFDSGPNIDFYGLGLIFLGISTTAGAINFIVTIAKLRAPGMSINRIPLFCWAVLGTSLAIVFAIPHSPPRRACSSSTACSASVSSTSRAAAIRCCGSTSSGSSATRTSTSSSCPRSGSCPRSSRPSRAGRWSRTRGWRSRR